MVVFKIVFLLLSFLGILLSIFWGLPGTVFFLVTLWGASLLFKLITFQTVLWLTGFVALVAAVSFAAPRLAALRMGKSVFSPVDLMVLVGSLSMTAGMLAGPLWGMLFAGVIFQAAIIRISREHGRCMIPALLSGFGIRFIGMSAAGLVAQLIVILN